MADYTVVFARSARKELEALDAPVIKRVFATIEALARQPRPLGCLKLTGEDKFWRIRVGDYRVIYEIDDHKQQVDIVLIRHRREAYQ